MTRLQQFHRFLMSEVGARAACLRRGHIRTVLCADLWFHLFCPQMFVSSARHNPLIPEGSAADGSIHADISGRTQVSICWDSTAVRGKGRGAGPGEGRGGGSSSGAVLRQPESWTVILLTA